MWAPWLGTMFCCVSLTFKKTFSLFKKFQAHILPAVSQVKRHSIPQQFKQKFTNRIPLDKSSHPWASLSCLEEVMLWLVMPRSLALTQNWKWNVPCWTNGSKVHLVTRRQGNGSWANKGHHFHSVQSLQLCSLAPLTKLSEMLLQRFDGTSHSLWLWRLLTRKAEPGFPPSYSPHTSPRAWCTESESSLLDN
jgi:hypothetical protein